MKFFEIDTGFYVNLEKIIAMEFEISPKEHYTDNTMRYCLSLALPDGSHKHIRHKNCDRIRAMFMLMGLEDPII